MSEQFSLRLLGGFGVYRDQHPLALPPSCQRVIALAALKRRTVHRSWICATLWPYAPPRQAAASLPGDPQPPGADPGLVADLLPLLRAGELLDGWAERCHAHERSRYHARRTTALNVLTRPSGRGWHEYGSHTGRPAHRENR